MFKLIVIAVVLYLVWTKLNAKNKQIVKDKFNQAKSVRLDVPQVQQVVEVTKERSRNLLIQIVVTLIGILTSLLAALLPSGNNDNNLPTIRR